MGQRVKPIKFDLRAAAFLLGSFLAAFLITGGLSSARAAAISQCPDNFVAFRGTTTPLSCLCPPVDMNASNVWGMDVYSEDSNICLAAVHAGVLTPAGGPVSLNPLPGQHAYAGATRNGLSSSNGGEMDGSFSFNGTPQTVAAPEPVSPPAPTPPVAQTAPATAPVQSSPPANAPSSAIAQCPDNFVAFRGTSQSLLCYCPPVDTAMSNVWGMDIYSEDSNICLAAVHAGFLTANGGNLTILAQPGKAAYAGVSRNNITSSNGGAMDGSFSFAPTVSQAVYVPVRPLNGPVPPVPLSQCPDNFVAFRGTTEPLSCACPPVDMSQSNIWGMDVYTEDSNICLAAVHYGILAPQGGNVSVLPMPGQQTYAGVTRNGLVSSNYGSMDGSYRFSPTLIIPAPVAVQTAAAPVQKPIAQSLQDTGQVQLYINFATDSDRLFPESEAVLNELLDALRADPSVKLGLIGHTDNVGTAEYNMTLSAKRADAVKFWLIKHGILPSRLQASGRGLMEPLDDNSTEFGRAVNRRVQAIKIQ